MCGFSAQKSAYFIYLFVVVFLVGISSANSVTLADVIIKTHSALVKIARKNLVTASDFVNFL